MSKLTISVEVGDRVKMISRDRVIALYNMGMAVHGADWIKQVEDLEGIVESIDSDGDLIISKHEYCFPEAIMEIV